MRMSKSQKAREDMFLQVLSNAIVVSFSGVMERLMEAAYEARTYYDKSSMTKKSNKNIMYWQGWIDCLRSIKSSCGSDYRELIRQYGGDDKMMYLAYYIALGLHHYEDFKNGKAEPLKITRESFSLFHENQKVHEKPHGEDDD